MAGLGEKSKGGATRVHRVFHRVGVVVGGLFLLGAIFALVAGVLGTMSGPRQVTEFSEIYSYPKPRLKGEIVFHDNGTSEPLWAYLAAENKTLASQHQSELGGTFFWSLGLALAGVAIYLCCRAVGWIIAGALE